MPAEGFLKKALRFLGVEDETVSYEEESAGFYEEEPTVRKIGTRKSSEQVIRAISGEKPSLRVFIAEPKNFNDVQVVANKYRLGVPVIINLQNVDDINGRRILDFVSGMVYALKGGITPIGKRIYIATPRNIEITPEERRKLRETFFRDLGMEDF